MRRPLNWVVVCLSLLFLMANLSVGRKSDAPVVAQLDVPLTELTFAHTVAAEKAVPEFGYVRADGSFLPLAQQPAVQPAEDSEPAEIAWVSAPSVASKVPARF